jgi:hypothetical protein
LFSMTSDELGAASDGPNPSAGSDPVSPPHIELSGLQRALFRALAARDGALASMYYGAVWALSASGNPDRLAQCAHSLRELMEKMSEVLDVPVKARKESLRVKVQEVESAFSDACKRSSCRAGAGWAGELDPHLRKFLTRVETFFGWFRNHNPRRRDELRTMLLRLDGTGRSLPEPLAEINVSLWDEMRDFFLAVAHHGREVDEAEFMQWMNSLERFLLDPLVPRTFEDFEAIDALLSGDAK